MFFDFYGHDGFAIVATSEGFLVASRSAANYKNLALVRLSHEGAEIGRRIIENFRFQSEPILQLNRGDKTESITNFSYKDVRNVHNFIQKTSDNNYIICGVTEVNEPDNKCFIIPSDLRVIKFNTSLNTIWDKNYSSPTVDEPLDMILLPSNEIVLLGTSCGEANEPKGPFNINNYTWMLKLNSTGNFKAIEGIDEYSQFAQIVTLGMNLSCDNKILISGKTYSASGIIPWIRKKEVDMKTNLWFSNLDYYNIAQINDIVLDKSNNIIGWGRANLGEDDVFIGKLKTECGSSGRCQKALPIQCGQTISGTTVGAVSSFDKTDYTCHSTSSPFDGGDVVYEFVMNNGTGNLDISLVSNTDLDIFLFDRCDATGLNCIAKSTYPTRPSGSNAN
ncbi:MAG: hypothetical protein IPO85_18155 [Saprospiraceae bacterium]|uniref:T9SS-like galactose binding domain-containing protein n=1 Tax=Candidatus Defluviibacterium haderslevense TaxID=2981993 RepID=A0A9D7XG58_9BACT|nr:hypothetical protein [Candidatus Defluviibacterium haderslevense]